MGLFPYPINGYFEVVFLVGYFVYLDVQKLNEL